MTEPSAIDAASKRLALALDALAAAVERRHEADRGEQTLDAQLHALGADRSRLASALGAAVAGLPLNRILMINPEAFSWQEGAPLSANKVTVGGALRAVGWIATAVMAAAVVGMAITMVL